MSDEAVQVWLVERAFTDKGLVTLTYATPDGERVFVQQRSATNLGDVTAARSVAPDKLAPADDADRERYAQEVDRMSANHDSDDAV
jgi:hypothetical protein